MDHAKIRHYTSITAIIGLSLFGVWYLMEVPEPRATVIITIVGAIAGLGGYQIKRRANGN